MIRFSVSSDDVPDDQLTVVAFQRDADTGVLTFVEREKNGFGDLGLLDLVNPVSLGRDELAQFKRVDMTCDVHCVTGWSFLDAKWSGIPLRSVMDFVGVKDDARYVILYASGGYKANIPMDEALKENVILADAFSGNPLPAAHGAPLRAVVPDLYFWKSVKWIQAIRFAKTDEPGFYETRGYSNSGDPWKEERFE